MESPVAGKEHPKVSAAVPTERQRAYSRHDVIEVIHSLRLLAQLDDADVPGLPVETETAYERLMRKRASIQQYRPEKILQLNHELNESKHRQERRASEASINDNNNTQRGSIFQKLKPLAFRGRDKSHSIVSRDSALITLPRGRSRSEPRVMFQAEGCDKPGDAGGAEENMQQREQDLRRQQVISSMRKTVSESRDAEPDFEALKMKHMERRRKLLQKQREGKDTVENRMENILDSVVQKMDNTYKDETGFFRATLEAIADEKSTKSKKSEEDGPLPSTSTEKGQEEETFKKEKKKKKKKKKKVVPVEEDEL